MGTRGTSRNGKGNLQVWIGEDSINAFKTIAKKSGFDRWQDFAEKLINEVNAGNITIKRHVTVIQR